MKRKLRNMVELKKLLKNPSPNLKVPVYDDNEEGIKPVKKSNEEKMTLAKLAVIVNDLAKEMRTGFKQVNNRLDKVEIRLDKVEKRLDNVDIRLDNIEKRLDYNNLKRLPN